MTKAKEVLVEGDTTREPVVHRRQRNQEYAAKVNVTMNTKTSYKCAHNFYDGGNHVLGKDSPGALLDMLAEVASRTLRSESARAESTNYKQKGEGEREVHWNLQRLLSMPQTQLVKQFTVFTSDELKRRYTYECVLVPGCRQKYTSFASESRARISITTHLVDHLEQLRNDQDSYPCEAKSGPTKCTRSKPAVQQVKKRRGPQAKKPQEIPDKENEQAKTEKSSYLRKILSSEIKLKEPEREKKLEDQNRGGRERCPMETKNDREIESNVLLGDHSYYEHVKDDTSPVEVNSLAEDPSIDKVISEKIMLMVVESDRVRIEELPSRAVTEDTIRPANPGDDSFGHTAFVPAKPKGKAKFIGTSKEEREMALVLMERIKKKGNPSGNNLQCRICDPPRSFTAPTTLVSHYRSHAGIKPYECRICRTSFTRRHSLKYHMLIHQNRTRFTCADCGKKFRHPSHFREHRRRHTGESPFGCDDCGQRFKTRNTYKRHLKTRHGKVLTTSGDLLCLTEEEFRKVQTNRKRKTPELSLEFPAEENFAGETTAGDCGGMIEVKDNSAEEAHCEYEESGDRILYDGIVGDGNLVSSPIEIFNNLSDSVKGEYAGVEIEYENEGRTSVVRYYDCASIVDQEILQFSDRLDKIDGVNYETSQNYLREVEPACADDKFSRQCNANNDNNNNDGDESNVEFVRPFFEETDNSEKQLATSTFVLLTDEDFKTNYLPIEEGGVVVKQE